MVPTYPRHPLAMAQQAATTNVLVGGRLALGIGPSHRMRIEDEHGLSYEKPARHVREYLSVLVPVLREESVDFKGETYQVTSGLQVQGNRPFPVLIDRAGSGHAPGGGRAGRRHHHVDGRPPRRRRARGAPDHGGGQGGGPAVSRIVVTLPIAVSDPDEGRRAAAGQFAFYAQLPNYRRMLDTGGADTPGDVAIVGDEVAVEAEVSAPLPCRASPTSAPPSSTSATMPPPANAAPAAPSSSSATSPAPASDPLLAEPAVILHTPVCVLTAGSPGWAGERGR